MSSSSTITEQEWEFEDGDLMPPVHPGEVLAIEFMEPLELSNERVAEALGLTPQEVVDFLESRRHVDADLALRLEHALSWDAAMWMRLQAAYDLELARRAGATPPDHLPVLHAAE
jgi:antitoxin HigA-1